MQKWSNFKNCCLYSKEVSNAVSSHSLRLSRLDNLMWPLAWMWASELIFIKRFFFLTPTSKPTYAPTTRALHATEVWEHRTKRLTNSFYLQAINQTPEYLSSSKPPLHPTSPLSRICCNVTSTTSVEHFSAFYDAILRWSIRATLRTKKVEFFGGKNVVTLREKSRNIGRRMCRVRSEADRWSVRVS